MLSLIWMTHRPIGKCRDPCTAPLPKDRQCRPGFNGGRIAHCGLGVASGTILSLLCAERGRHPHVEDHCQITHAYRSYHLQFEVR